MASELPSKLSSKLTFSVKSVRSDTTASKSPFQHLRRRLEEQQADEDRHQDDEEDYEDALNSKNNIGGNIEEATDLIQAGAHKAKLQYKAIDRHSEQRAIQLKEHLAQNVEHQQEHKEKYELSGGFAREEAILNNQEHEHDKLTSKMKIHIPGTKEFKARQKALMDKVKSLQDPKKQEKEEDKNPIVPIQHVGKDTAVTTNDEKKKKGKILPFLAKHLPKPPANLLRRTVAKIPLLRLLHKPMSLEEEMILDASVSFFVHLETMIYENDKDGLGSEQQMIALSDWLDLVGLTLPPEWHLHKLIDDLQQKFTYIAEGSEHLHEILAKHKLSHKQWSHECTIDRGKFHVGFDCGFWKLLHIVTLGVAEQRGGMNLVQAEMVPTTTKTFSPLEAADILRNLIQFYYNPDYSPAFVEDYDDCNKHRRCDRLTNDKEGASVGDWKELPLWLWEVHNEIAVQALTKKTQKKQPELLELSQQDEMKVIWPSVVDCHLCFQDDGTWNENEVFHFLEEHYWIGTDVDPKYDHLLRFQGEDEDATLFSIGGLTAVFLVILYILMRLVLGKSHTIQIAVRRAQNYANFKQSKARTV
ncbi:MAG: hypothetical protein SGBAC_005171 [Bacillariaceae sp.]